MHKTSLEKQKNLIKQNTKTMALPLIPLIAGGAALAGSITSAISARRMQKRQMQQDQQFWQQQNEYNSPQKQMERLQAAGLNPNLVYGGSPSGAAGQAERLKTPDVDSSAHRWIEPDGAMSTIGGYADWNVKQAQVDNLKANTQSTQENALLTATKTYGEGLRNAKTHLDVRMAEDLYENSVEHAKESLRKLRADTQYTLSQNERADITLANNTAQAVESVLSSRLGRQLTSAQIANVRADNSLKQLDMKLAKMGIRPSDPFYASAIARFAIKYMEIFRQNRGE